MNAHPGVLVRTGAVHDSVLKGLAEFGVPLLLSTGRTEFDEETLACFRSTGTDVGMVEDRCPEPERKAIWAWARERALQIGECMTRASIVLDDPDAAVPLGSGFFTDDWPLAYDLAESEVLVRSLDRVAQTSAIGACVVSEDFMPQSRVLVLWARSRGIPSFHVHHGTHLGRLDNFTREGFADYQLAAGRRAAEWPLWQGFDPAAIVVTGAPQFDHYATLLARRDEVRCKVRTSCGLLPDEPIVLFAATTWGVMTRFTEFGISESTLRAFCGGARHAMDRSGRRFGIVVKDRLPPGQAGKPLVDAVLREFGIPGVYVTGRPEELVCAADLVLGCDSNMLVESMLCGVPAINIWAPLNWLTGPYFRSDDGVPLFRCDDVQGIGEEMVRRLYDPACRAAAIARQTEALSEIVDRPDGRAGARCARFILAAMTRPGSPSSPRLR